MESVIEQRKEKRTSLLWPISMWLPEANRFFNAKSENVSRGGVYLTVPMTTPVRAGNVVELNFPRTEDLAKEKGGFSRIKSGKVVRVERDDILTDADIGVAIEFL